MGAGVSATVAALYPELVSGVILEDPWWPGSDEGTPEEQVARASAWRQEIIERQAQTAEQIIATRKTEQSKWADEEFAGWATAKQHLSPNVTQYITAPRKSWRELVGQIRCPVLLITADVAEGALVTPEVAAEAVKLMPKGRVVHIPGAGHNIRREQFEAYMTAVRAFLAKLV